MPLTEEQIKSRKYGPPCMKCGKLVFGWVEDRPGEEWIAASCHPSGQDTMVKHPRYPDGVPEPEKKKEPKAVPNRRVKSGAGWNTKKDSAGAAPGTGTDVAKRETAPKPKKAVVPKEPKEDSDEDYGEEDFKDDAQKERDVVLERDNLDRPRKQARLYEGESIPGMVEGPAMQNLLQNPHLLQQNPNLLQQAMTNPQLLQMLATNPQQAAATAAMMNNPEVLAQHQAYQQQLQQQQAAVLQQQQQQQQAYQQQQQIAGGGQAAALEQQRQHAAALELQRQQHAQALEAQRQQQAAAQQQALQQQQQAQEQAAAVAAAEAPAAPQGGD